jgi:hypothetical protein
MKRLMRIHRYLSCFVAPAMLFFALSGSWQAFRLQDSRKDGSYVAPIVLSVLSDIHKASELSGLGGLLFRGGQVLLAAGFAATAVIGLVMAYRLTRPTRLFWFFVAAGVMVPIILALLRS